MLLQRKSSSSQQHMGKFYVLLPFFALYLVLMKELLD